MGTRQAMARVSTLMFVSVPVPLMSCAMAPTTVNTA